MNRDSPVVIGVDIGTTSTKIVAYDALGGRRAAWERGYSLDEPRPGYAVQDPDTVFEAVVTGLVEVVGQLRPAGLRGEGRAEIAGVAFSSAMHSLVGVDEEGRPLTGSVTWADLRAVDQARRLREAPLGPALHRATGTPVHPMSPLTKLMWFREVQPELAAAVAKWVGIKEYVTARLTGEYVMDRSIASGTGLCSLASGSWYPAALAAAGVDAARFPAVVPTRHRMELTEPMARRLDLVGVPVIVGAGDGPLANLGSGAVRPGVASCSLGTSGAVRLLVDSPGIDAAGRVFCYHLTEGRWAVGGAISNGGDVLDWVGAALAPDVAAAGRAGAGKEALIALASEAPAGSDGLLMLPYLLSERAPHWNAQATGVYIGLTRAHRRPHLVRAALEGVCQQLALVLEAVGQAGYPVSEIRATGGFLRDHRMRALLTDVMGRDIGFTAATDGSAFGAALLGMEALGLVDNLDLAADLVPVVETLHPDAGAAATYRRQREVFKGLFDTLAPTFRAMHEQNRASPE